MTQITRIVQLMTGHRRSPHFQKLLTPPLGQGQNECTLACTANVNKSQKMIGLGPGPVPKEDKV